MRININDFDDELYNKVSDMAAERGCKKLTAPSLIHFVFTEYLSLCQLSQFDNPLMLKKIQGITEAALDETERRLGGRLMKLISDNTINLSVLTQIFHDTMNQFDDPVEAELRLSQYRARAVEQLRENKAPLTYIQLVKEPADE